MSNKKLYIRYIAHHVERLHPNIEKTEWIKFFKKILGTGSASEPKLKNLALTLYYSHYAGLMSCTDDWKIIEELKTPNNILKLIESSEELRKKYDLEFSLQYFKSEIDVINHMNRFQGSEKSLKGLVSFSLSTTKSSTVKSSTVKSSTVKSSTVKSSTVKSLSSSSTATSSSKYNVKELREMAAKKNISGRGKMNKAELLNALGLGALPTTTKKQKTCNDYNLQELRKIAGDKNIKGRSKMKKSELCKALRIKT